MAVATLRRRVVAAAAPFGRAPRVTQGPRRAVLAPRRAFAASAPAPPAARPSAAGTGAAAKPRAVRGTDKNRFVGLGVTGAAAVAAGVWWYGTLARCKRASATHARRGVDTMRDAPAASRSLRPDAD